VARDGRDERRRLEATYATTPLAGVALQSRRYPGKRSFLALTRVFAPGPLWGAPNVGSVLSFGFKCVKSSDAPT